MKVLLTGKAPEDLSSDFSVVLSIVRCCLSIRGNFVAHGEGVAP